MTVFLVTALCFLAVFAVNTALYNVATRKRRELLKRIDDHSKIREHSFYGNQAAKHAMSILKSIGSIFVTRKLALKVEGKLVRAGLPLKGEEGITLWFLVLSLAGILAFAISRDIGLSIITAALAGFIPIMWLNSRINKRMHKFDSQISGALTVIANSLRAGFSFMQAMEMVSSEMSDPIASEFKRVLRELHLGTPTEQAMHNLSKRVGSGDLDLVVTAVLIQRQVGGNLAEVLDSISGTIRERIRVAGEIKTLTAHGRISGLVIGLLPICLTVVIYMMNPEYIMVLFTDPRGLILLTMGVVSQVLGMMFIRKIVNISL